MGHVRIMQARDKLSHMFINDLLELLVECLIDDPDGPSQVPRQMDHGNNATNS